MFSFQRCIRLSQRLISSPQGRQHSQSLEINPADNAGQCCPHDNIVGSHVCDECMKSILLIVCRMPESILWLLLQVCWPTTESLVFQVVPGTSMSRQIGDIFVAILQSIRVPLAWIDDHPNRDFKLCLTAPLSCLPARSIAQRIFEHVLPCRRTTRRFFAWSFSTPVIFHPAAIRDSNIFENSSTIISFGLHSRWVHPKYTWSRNEVGSSRSTFFINFFHMESHILLLSSHIEKNNLCFRWPNKQTFSIWYFLIQVLSQSNLANGWPYKFRSRGTTWS